MKIISFILLSLLVTLAGCFEKTNTRYQPVHIPGYTDADYYAMLSLRNNEKIYNAICNLTFSASTLAGILSSEKPDSLSAEYSQAEKIYNKIKHLMFHRNNKIKSAAIRFMSEFGKNYNHRDEIILSLQEVQSYDINVQFEQVTALTNLCNTKSPVSMRFLKKMMFSHSWMVSRAACSLVDVLENNEAREVLRKSYVSAGPDYEKILILNSLKSHYDEKTFALLKNELTSGKNPKIRSFIFSILGKAKDTAPVSAWIASNYSQFTGDDIHLLAEYNYDSLHTAFSSSLFVLMLENNFQPVEALNEDSIPKLYSSLFNACEKADSGSCRTGKENLQSIESAIMKRDDLAPEWEMYRDKISKNGYMNLPSGFVSEYNKTTAEFIENTKKLMGKYNIRNKENRIQTLESVVRMDKENVEK